VRVSAPGAAYPRHQGEPGVEAASSHLSCAFRRLHRPLALWSLKAAGSRFYVFCHHSSYRDVLCAEARVKGFIDPTPIKGGVTVRGGWPEVWRANLELRGASRVLARVAAFRAFHLAQLDKRARRVAWSEFLRPDVPVRVEAACKGSRIYHAGAATQRIEKAIREELGAPISAEAEVVVKARIDDDLCTISIDTSGESLHKRDHKEAVHKAPLRETQAAHFLRQCGYDGTEAVIDPMCGSGTFVTEAAEIAAGLKPGRSRRFAFEQLAGFDEAAWSRMRGAGDGAGGDGDIKPAYGSMAATGTRGPSPRAGPTRRLRASPG
jgi:putative N6-adenine-specific DNA methylase